jgi:hypothetical protein
MVAATPAMAIVKRQDNHCKDDDRNNENSKNCMAMAARIKMYLDSSN